jgi:hypothetical protein
MWISELITKTATADSRIGSQSSASETIETPPGPRGHGEHSCRVRRPAVEFLLPSQGPEVTGAYMPRSTE